MATVIIRAGRHKILVLSFGITFLAFTAALGILLMPGVNANAGTCTWATATTGTYVWTTTSNWSCTTASSYPGQTTTDAVNLNFTAGAPAFELDVNSVIPNAVVTTIGCGGSGCLVRVQSGGTLPIGGSSTIGSSFGGPNQLTIDAGGTVANTGTIGAVVNGQINLNGGTLDNAAIGGITLTSTGGPSQFNWSGGTIQNSGSIQVASTGVMNMTGTQGAMLLNGQTITGNGPINFSSASNALTMSGAAQIAINNGSTMALTGNGGITAGAGSPLIAVATGGAISNTASALTISVPLNNSGSVSNTGSGTLSLTGGGTHAGAFGAPSTGASLLFSGTHAFGSGTSFGSGVSATPYTFSGAGSSFNFSVPVTIPGLNWIGGTIGGGNTLSLSSTNVFNSAAAPLAIAGGTFVKLPATTGGSLSLAATADIGGPGTLQLGNTTGTITVNGTPNNIGAVAMLSSAPISYGSATAGLNFTGGGSLTGGTLPSGAATNSLTFGGTSPFALHSGTLSGAGPINVANGATLQIDSTSGTVGFSGASPTALNNAGTISIIGPTTAVDFAGFQIANQGTGTINLQTDASLTNTVAGSTIANAGMFEKTGAGATSGIALGFTNAGGTVFAANGTMDFTNAAGYTQSSGTTTLGGGNISVLTGSGTMTLNGGILNGSGTVQASVANNAGATVTPGLTSPITPGSITVSGIYTQSGTLAIKLAGTTPGSGYDILNVGGAASLGGPLIVSYVSPFTSPNGQTYTVVSSGGADTGAFSSASFPPPTGAWSTNYIPTAAQIAFASIDLTLTKTAAATSVGNGQNIVYTITVKNNDPSLTATNVNVSDTFSGPATFTSASASGGMTCSGASSPITCTVASLAPGATDTITLTLTANATGTVANSATASATQFDPNLADNTASVNVTVNPAADLGLGITGPAAVNAGQSSTYTATISNAGPDTAASYSATFSVTGATLVSATGGMSCTVSGNTASCTGSALASGGNATVSIVATPGTGASMVVSGTVAATAPTVDPNSANDSASFTSSIAPSADIETLQSASPTSMSTGQNATFTILVKNLGPSPATGVNVSDSYTGGTLVSVSSTAGTSCTGTLPVTCTIASLGVGATETITLTLTSSTVGTLTNNTTANSPAFDPNTTNNNSTASVAVGAPTADLSIAKSGPSATDPGSKITFTLTVKNAGPGAAPNVVISDPTPAGLSLSSVTGSGCTAFPCTIASLASGAITTVNATYTVTAQKAQTITNTASVTSALVDPNTADNSASATTQVRCATAATPQLIAPADPTKVPVSGTLSWSGSASLFVVYLGPAGTACNSGTPYTTTTANQISYSGLAPNTDYEWRVVASDCQSASSVCGTFHTAAGCTTAPPAPITPVASAQVSSPVTFTWTSVANATSYEVFVVENGITRSLGTTTGTSVSAAVANGSLSWYVVANTTDCGPLTSNTTIFNVCNTPGAPIASVVANAASGQTYTLAWDPVAGAGSYEVQESTNASFSPGSTTTQTVTGNSVVFTHSATGNAQPFFYQVRAIAACNPQQKSNYSSVDRIVIAPLVLQTRNPNANVPAGSTKIVVQQVFVPGIPDGGNYSFTASVDKPWLTVSPSSGILPAAGVTLSVNADPSTLPNGTFTGTVIVTISSTATSASAVRPDSTSSTYTIPVSVSLVTPVSPTSPTTTPANALIIPSVGHLDGLASQWQSDIRLANTGFSKQQYILTFTPTATGGSNIVTTGMKQTQVTVDAGATMALDDVARNWFGVGSLGEAANGVLMVRPLDTAHSNATTPSISTTTAVSSRTYSVSNSGTLGQYIPAVPFSAFISAAASGQIPTVLTLQQIAQSDAYRTNIGLVEAAGSPAGVTLSVFDDSGKDIKDFPISLNPFQQLQLNSFLAAQGITLPDGRIQVKVTSGAGRVTAYASVVDNRTNDPLLISGVPLNSILSSRYVLPGVADLSNGQANWRSDVRVFNSGAAPQSATLTLYPLGGGNPLTANTTLNPGEVKQLDGIVQAMFGATNVGGALHITTPSDSNLVVTGRTYNAAAGGGTYGQFIPAVTAADAVGLGDRTLQVLQVEDSPRYRTNLGIAEVTGKAATAEITVYLPDSKVAPRVDIQLNPYEYRQFAVLQQLGLGNVYNARISVNVVSGTGKITAYGSVVDQQTQDPTYVPAQ